MIVTSMLPIRAGMNPSIVNPETIFADRVRINALRINLNKPNVRIFMGSVSKDKIGLTNILSRPNTRAARMAVTKLVT